MKLKKEKWKKIQIESELKKCYTFLKGKTYISCGVPYAYTNCNNYLIRESNFLTFWEKNNIWIQMLEIQISTSVNIVE